MSFCYTESHIKLEYFVIKAEEFLVCFKETEVRSNKLIKSRQSKVNFNSTVGCEKVIKCVAERQECETTRSDGFLKMVLSGTSRFVFRPRLF